MKNIHSKMKNDLTLIGALLLLAVIVLVLYYLVFFGEDGNHVTISVDGQVTGTYLLSVDNEISIQGLYGTNLLSVKNGKAEMIEADCPDLICCRHRAISKTGETIVCLPNRIVVSITGSSATDVDAISQ